MKLVTNKFQSGGLHEKRVVATWSLGEPSQHLLLDTGKPRKTCVTFEKEKQLVQVRQNSN
jgi:hypothetical protein